MKDTRLNRGVCAWEMEKVTSLNLVNGIEIEWCIGMVKVCLSQRATKAQEPPWDLLTLNCGGIVFKSSSLWRC